MDIFDVREQERQEAARIEASIAQVSAALELAKRAGDLKQSPGFNDFVKALDDVIETAMKRLVTSVVSDAELRELRGRVTAFKDVRRLLFPGDSTAALADQLRRLQDQRVELQKRTPKPRGPES